MKLDLPLLAALVLLAAHLGLQWHLMNPSPYLIVRGISMEPTYHAGDLLLSRAVRPIDIEIGDVIAFRVAPEERRRYGLPAKVAHRVMGIRASEGRLVFDTKGDNSEPDPFTVPSDAVIGKVARNLGPIAWPMTALTRGPWLAYILIPVVTFVAVLFAANRLQKTALPAQSSIDANGEESTDAGPGPDPETVVPRIKDPVERPIEDLTAIPELFVATLDRDGISVAESIQGQVNVPLDRPGRRLPEPQAPLGEQGQRQATATSGRARPPHRGRSTRLARPERRPKDAVVPSQRARKGPLPSAGEGGVVAGPGEAPRPFLATSDGDGRPPGVLDDLVARAQDVLQSFDEEEKAGRSDEAAD